MRLLNFVEKQQGKRLFLHCVGELAALGVAGRGAEEPLVGVLGAVFAHVKSDQPLGLAEQRRGEGLGHFRLADASRTREEEHTARTI
jgi:hypothetical protein